MPQSPRTQGVEKPRVDQPSDSMATAAAAAAAAAVAAANAAVVAVAAASAAGFGNEGVASPAGGIGMVQRPASLGLQRASSAGARRRDLGLGTLYKDLDCTGTSGGSMCGSLSARGLASHGDAQARALKRQAPASPLPRKTLPSISARASLSPSPRRITSSNVDARENRAGRISALKSELDLLKSKRGTIRQQLQHFRASQTKLPDEAAEPCELRLTCDVPED